MLGRSRKGISPLVAVIIIFLLILTAVYIASQYYQQQPPSPTALSFALDFPKVISPGQSMVGYVRVANNGTDAKDVVAVVTSDAISAVSEKADVEYGSPIAIRVTISGKDAQDGFHAMRVHLEYLDEFGSHKTETKDTSIYLLPNVELTDVRFEPDLFHLFGKNTISKKDSTTLKFRVHSKSGTVIYNGIWAKASLSMNVAGISISPSSIQVESIGPHGQTGDYSFKITSDNTPVGTYNLIIYLYSKDNQQIMQQTVQLTVTG